MAAALCVAATAFSLPAAALAAPARPAPPGWARLPDLLRRARLTVVGTVTRTAAFDDGRVVVAYIHPDRVLSGDAVTGEVAVVEEHDLPSSPTLLPQGRTVVVFLTRAARTSSLARALPAGPTYWALVQGRMGVVTSESPQPVRDAGEIVARWAALAADTKSDAATRAAAQRTLAFDELAAAHPIVVEDGVAAVGGIAGLTGTLTEPERQRIVDALRRRDLPPRVPAALIRVIAAQRLQELLPTLRALNDAPADVLAASWDAQRQLGSPPSFASLTPFLKASDAAVRAAVPAALLATGDPQAAPAVEKLALEDSDADVRKAATKSLGDVKAPGGLEALARIYKSSAELRTTAGNAIVAWGGDDAADTLTRLAFDAPSEAQQWAVTLIFALGRTKDDPRLVRIRTTHPDPAIRDLIDKGIDLGHHHDHP